MPPIFPYLSQAARIFSSSFKSRLSSSKYTGSAREICQQIIEDCWNGRFFQTSTHNFPQFWTRDFGWCCKSLLQLGHKDRVHQTLRYALHRFEEEQKITTTLTPEGKAFDFPYPAIDSLPYFIHSLKISRFPYQQHKRFLNRQLKRFFEENIDPLTGLVNPEKTFSSMKDLSIRKSSCYDNTLVAFLAKDLKTMKLDNPFKKFDYPELLKHHFWNGKFFYDDLTQPPYVAGDANLFPFALGIIQDQEMLESALKSIKEAGLDQPFPLRYTNKEAKVKFLRSELFLKNYEFDTVWTHMGPLYIQLVKKNNPTLAQEYKASYTRMIERYGNYLEVFSVKDNQVRPFRTPFYFCDRGMLWAANYLTL